MQSKFYVRHSTLTDGSLVHDVMIRDSLDDEPIEFYASEDEKSADALADALNTAFARYFAEWE